MNKFIVLLCFIFYIPLATSEPALFKEITIEPIERVFVRGNIELNLIQANEYKVQIKVRKTSKSNLKLGIEKQDNSKRLVITEELEDTFSVPEPNTMAKVTLYTPNIKAISLQGTASLNVTDIKINGLYLNARKNTAITMANVEIQRLNINLSNSAVFKGEGLMLENLNLKQYKNSALLIKNSQSKKIIIKSKNKSKVVFENIKSDFLKVSLQNSTQLEALNNNIFGIAELTIKNNGKFNSKQSEFEYITINARNRSKIELGKAKYADIRAKDYVNIWLYPSQKTNVTKSKTVVVERYVKKDESVNSYE